MLPATTADTRETRETGQGRRQGGGGLTSLSGRDGLAAFQQAASTLFAPLRILPKEPDRFRVGLRRADLDDIVVAAIRGPAGRVVRDHREITASDRHLVKALIQVEGYASVEQDGRRRIAPPGSLFLCETTRSYELSYPDSYSTVVVGVPAERLRVSESRRRDAVAAPRAGDLGLGRLVSGFLRDLASDIDDVGVCSADGHLANAVTALVDGILDTASPEAQAPHPGFIDHVLAFCEASLGDPDLTVAGVARRFGVSLRYLQKASAAQDISLGRWIRGRRLDHIARDLVDDRQADRCIAAVAARWGMLDGAHLSRAFRERLGTTPREYRAAGRTPLGGQPCASRRIEAPAAP